ncbi:MAG: S-adenosylmethionine/S-adenosylhomocysteine transporter [Chlamydiae bacterium]|nr:S-adenosylmethionine/S-adenosylhomocysteine transporter [Chlamydiota bacterium]
MFWMIFGFGLLASAFTANKFILHDLNPVFFVAVRMGISGLLLVGYYLIKRSKNLRIKHLFEDGKQLILVCVFTNFVPAILKAYALKALISSEAVLIGSLDPFVTAIYAYFLFGDRLSMKQFLGIFIGFLSILLLVSAKHPILGLNISMPVLYAFGAVVIGRYGWILTQKLLKKDRYHPAEINGISMLASGVFALMTSFFMGNEMAFDVCFNQTNIGFMLYTIIIGNIISYTMIAYFLKHHPVTLVSLLGFSVPIFTHFYGWMFLQEPLSWQFFIAVLGASLGFMIYKLKLHTKSYS